MTNKRYCLNTAIDIVKEYARGGGEKNPDFVLENVYKKLVELDKEISE